ncbi:MAG: penicillin-binding transpeptidase domain-containing protein [Clostridia bacterium]
MEKKNNPKNKKNINKKVTKINTEFKSQNFVYTKKIKTIFIVIILILAILIGRIGLLQFVQGNYLKELAYNQQSINQIISPKRGTIYDSHGQILATSASVDTITINPEKIKDSKVSSNTQALKEKVAKAFSDIFGLDYDETLKKVTSTSNVETIVKKVEQDKVDELKAWMKENKISTGINIDEDTKRYYPHNSVLAQVLGSCGSDNQGLSGIEYEWKDVLSGTPGKIVSSKSASQEEIPNTEETYIAAENGSDLTLTVDLNIQKIVEKYLKQAVDENNVENGGTCIVMDPKTGDILAMATYPSYDLNNPFTPNEYVAKTYDSLSSEDKANAIYKMWSNKAVSELYEPGSVFKLITAATALEENITDTDVANDFKCNGYEMVGTTRINCWKTDGTHGSQDLRHALMNSCNPALIQLGARIGTTTLYKYYRAFGFFDTTGVDLPGEPNSIFKEESTVLPVERATYSFGQRFSITPLQMITAISAIANDGILMKPRIVKSITNTDTGAVTSIDPEEVRQVISTETAEKVKSMMQSVVEYGTGKRGGVTGYTVGGKTGTSEPMPGREDLDGYVATYVAISPVEDTQVVLLLNLYKPPKSNHQGGTLAGPVVSQMLTEILPLLGIPSDADSSDDENLITVPEVRNKTIAEAEKILKNAGFTTKITTSNDKNSTVVTEQVPKPGATLSKDSIIMLYDQDTRTSATVPDLTGKSKYQATTELKNANLNISIEGTGTVVSQDPPKGSNVDAGTVVKVTLKQV